MSAEPVRRVAVITDSTADLPVDVAARHSIVVVPLSVTIGGETIQDGSITQAEFFERMRSSSRLPTTSQPPVGAFVQAYERALRTADQVVSVHISSKLSGTLESARQAAERFKDRVHVFDSLNLSWGLAWQVLEAAQAAAEGLGCVEVLERVGSVRDRVRIIVGLDGLDNLAKGGRIGRVSALLGSLLNLKVTLTVDADGAFTPVGRDRGERAALAHTLDWVGEHLGPMRRGRFAVGHALSEARARWLADAVRERFDATDVVLYEAGSVISAHTGTGWGICFVPEG